MSYHAWMWSDAKELTLHLGCVRVGLIKADEMSIET